MLLTAGTALLLLLASPLQDDEGSAAIRREAAYSRALEAELGFHDLAEAVLEEALRKAANHTDRNYLLFTRCEVRKLTAQRSTDPEERLAAYAAAADAYREFLGTQPPIGLANRAQTDLAEIAFQFGEALSQALSLGRIRPEGRPALVARAESVFEGALEGAGDLLEWFNGLPDGDEKDAARFQVYFPTLFFRALIYYYWGLIYDSGSLERNENIRLAIENLEAFIFEVGQNSRAGLLGFKYIADAYAARGDVQEDDDGSAEIYYQHVIENAVPEDADPPLSPQEIDARRGVAQQAYKGYLDFLLSRGLDDKGFQVAQDFRQWLEDENVLPNDDGYRVMLSTARMLSSQGKFDAALALTREVASENERSVLRLEANEVERTILAHLPEDVAVDLAVLYGAAEGAFFQDKFEEAIRGFRRLIPRLEGSSQADDYAAATYYYLGRSWSSLERPLEAAATFQAGFERYADAQDGDFAERLADGWYKIAERLAVKDRDDPVLDQFLRDALAAKTSAGGGDTPDAAVWRQAQSNYGFAKDKAREARPKGPGSPEAREAIRALDRALSDYRQIQRGSRYFEKSIVQQGMCLFRKTEFDPTASEEAFKLFDDYLEVYTADPTNTPQDATGRKTRADATAQADFYRGQVRLRQAKQGGPEAAAHWQEVLDLYAGYPDRHPNQRDYGAASRFHRIEAWLALDRVDDAVKEYEQLVAEDPPSSWLNAAAFGLYRAYAAAAAAAEPSGRRPLLVQAAAYLHQSNQADSTPTWQNEVQEARLRLELGEPATTAQILERVLRRHADDPSFRGNPRFFAELDLVKALLAQDKVALAVPYIDRLRTERPNNLDVKESFIKVKVGYLVLREGGVVEIPGEGTPEAFAAAEKEIVELKRLAESDARKADVSKFKYCPWWEAQVIETYFLYRRGLVDTTYLGQHKGRITGLERQAPQLGAAAGCDDIPIFFQWLKSR